ncbi:MAG TPA: hypothetical protein VML55_23945 [Planctomycetaceae bacterium]|nr:hypothetical protein [Planctomycetaceae bacterium]
MHPDEPVAVPQPPFEAYRGRQPFAFVSYSHRDAAAVYEEMLRLHETGLRLWYDETIVGFRRSKHGAR